MDGARSGAIVSDFLKSHESLSTWVIVLLLYLIIPDKHYVSIRITQTPIRVKDILLEVSNNSSKFDGLAFEDDEPGNFSGKFNKEFVDIVDI